MRFQFIVCKVMQQEAFFCAARTKNIVDTVFIDQRLHTEPAKLQKTLQKALDCTCDADGISYDASLLGYGFCSNAISGLSAEIPIVIPKAHDCITLLLGSKDRYRQYFDNHPGVYWYSRGWIKTNTQPGKKRYEKTLNEYRAKYGRDNAEYLVKAGQDWINKYQLATYIDWGFTDSDKDKQYTKDCAEFMGWKYDQIKGSASLVQGLLDGFWNEDEFLIVKPGWKIIEDLTSENIIKAVPK